MCIFCAFDSRDYTWSTGCAIRWDGMGTDEFSCFCNTFSSCYPCFHMRLLMHTATQIRNNFEYAILYAFDISFYCIKCSMTIVRKMNLDHFLIFGQFCVANKWRKYLCCKIVKSHTCTVFTQHVCNKYQMNRRHNAYSMAQTKSGAIPK